jgi:hypothetical protein
MPSASCSRWAILFAEIDSALRCTGRHAVGRGTVPWARIGFTILGGGALYGAVMGSLGGDLPGSIYSMLKAPLLLAGTTILCLPFFFVLNAALGLRDDFTAALRGILSAQGTLALCLAGMAPPLIIAYVSRIAYPTALLCNGAAFGIATLAGHLTLARHYRPLIATDHRHRVGLTAWLLLYVFVAIKLGWVLRPFVGDPALETVFMRAGAFDENPYVVLFWTVAAFVLQPFMGVMGF